MVMKLRVRLEVIMDRLIITSMEILLFNSLM